MGTNAASFYGADGETEAHREVTGSHCTASKNRREIQMDALGLELYERGYASHEGVSLAQVDYFPHYQLSPVHRGLEASPNGVFPQALRF